MNVIIRQGNENDFPQIFALIQEFAIFQKTPEKLYITLEQMLANKDLFKCLVAEIDGAIVGFASYFFTYYSWSGKGLYLDDLYVKNEYRKLNIGGSLLNEIIALAKKEDCKKVRWLVSRWNENAISFYKKIGAVVDDTEMTCDLSLT